ADTLRDLPDRERLPHAGTADVRDQAAELLLALLVALDHAHHDLDREAGSQVRALGLELTVLDFLQQAHGGLLSTRNGPRTHGLLQAARQYTGARASVSRHHSVRICAVFAGIPPGGAKRRTLRRPPAAHPGGRSGVRVLAQQQVQLRGVV